MFQRGVIVMSVLLLSSGCADRPTRVEAPRWDASELADRVLAELDKNQDGQVDSTEMQAAPGLAAGGRIIDTDADGQLSREELEARFEIYGDMRIGMMSKTLRIAYDGRPLRNAEVRLVPEFFLVDLLESAVGTTDVMGMVQPAIEGERLAVMRVGYYRVEVRSSQVELPDRFNTATEIGVEIPPVSGDPTAEGTIEIGLWSKSR